MKKKIGQLKDKIIVEGNTNLVDSSREIHINNLNEKDEVMYFRFYDYLDIDNNAAEVPFITSVINLSIKAFYKDFNNEASYQWVVNKAFKELPNLIFEVHDNCIFIEYEEGYSTHVQYLTNILTQLKSYIEEKSPEIRTKLLSYIVHKN